MYTNKNKSQWLYIYQFMSNSFPTDYRFLSKFKISQKKKNQIDDLFLLKFI